MADDSNSENGNSMARKEEAEEEEEMIMRLFRPRTSSIGSECDYFPDYNQDGPDVSFKGGEDFEGAAVGSVPPSSGLSAVTNQSSLKNTERQLKSAEKSFLESTKVRTSDISLADMAKRFNKTVVPTNPLKVSNFKREELGNCSKKLEW
jgi:hypothetical protein